MMNFKVINRQKSIRDSDNNLYNMFKKRNNDKKNKINLQEIKQDDLNEQADQIKVPKLQASRKINKFSNKVQKNITQNKALQSSSKIVSNNASQHDKLADDKQRRQQNEQNNQDNEIVKVRYGLIDKEDVNAKYHANLQGQTQKKPQGNTLVSLYVKKKMDEIKKNGNANNISSADSEIMIMQKKYLKSDKEKLMDYDIAQIQKKLETNADNSIKNQILARANYLTDLLQNEHERQQYASKKQLKTLRQEKQRLEKNFQSKYNDYGRRSYVEKIKHQSMLNN